ncbi:MAG: NADH-quinone oxidoreductase subunit C [Nitrososphaerota archaeon]|nr:NADH-quinone oxidoreductase subunit C [Nitrososphaerota archaeon]MDG6952824.1 NADH-quinone oxidoreductase subunit C [Nitrososphaerota archaeon]MDG6956135.1 NADH-quinone oxidoreductase subunit C [Nitrososphaerota archaeon]MDG6959949.1 NADH-quinone oxidoreductase subunit C [Nitrososphaerota archaeon]MDG6969261.1 NADH-quinone oxidoreductase subunit C [Nitrososphaerota archaeon]
MSKESEPAKPASPPLSAPTQPAKPATPSPPAAASAPAPSPDLDRAKALATRITSSQPTAKVEWMKPRRLKVSASPNTIKDVALFARDSLGFNHISAVSGVDWIAKNELEVIYFVGSTTHGQEDFVLAVSERIPRDNPVVPTLIGVWKGAEYQERETHEMFGINFQGHPDQSHLFLPEDWNDLPPLRKDYVSPGR